MCTRLKSRLVADWSVANMNPDITPNRMLFVVSVSTEKKIQQILNLI